MKWSLLDAFGMFDKAYTPFTYSYHRYVLRLAHLTVVPCIAPLRPKMCRVVLSRVVTHKKKYFAHVPCTGGKIPTLGQSVASILTPTVSAAISFTVRIINDIEP